MLSVSVGRVGIPQQRHVQGTAEREYEAGGRNEIGREREREGERERKGEGINPKLTAKSQHENNH